MAESFDFVVFRLNTYQYALPLNVVEKVVRVVQIMPVPHVPHAILGIINVHGRIAPVLDLQHWLGGDPQEVTLSHQLVLVNTSKRLIALLVDEIQGVITPSVKSVLSTEEILPGISYLKGGIKSGESLILVQNVEALLSSEDEAKLTDLLKEMV